MEDSYVQVLIQSLEQKNKTLDAIVAENKTQSEVLKGETLNEEAFQATIDKKAELIERIRLLDNGFEKIYDRVKELLPAQREKYQKEIATMQGLIETLAEKTAMVQKQEQENRRLAESQFSNARRRVRQARNSTQVASKYRTNMARLNYIEPQFMDKKK